MNPDFSALLRTPLTERLGCRYPIIQTAMGWVADANLVIATTRAGGFGFLAGATIAADQLEAEIKRVIAATGGSNFGLNFHMFQDNAAQCVDQAIQYRLRAVSYGRGPDKKTIARFKEAGVLCIPTVGAVKHAVKAVELGADMITIQGGEGGGHTGGVPSSILLPQVLDAVKVPVIAAGGYSTGRGLAGALAAGAAGIAMGTRFMMTTDSPTPPSHPGPLREGGRPPEDPRHPGGGRHAPPHDRQPLHPPPGGRQPPRPPAHRPQERLAVEAADWHEPRPYGGCAAAGYS